MLARLLVVLVIAGGCSGKSDPPAPANVEKLGFPFVSDTIANQMGDANVIIAIDLGRFGLQRFAPMIPDMLGCVKDLLGKVGVAVIAGNDDAMQGFVTGIPEEATKKCIGTLAPLVGAKTEDQKGAFQLAMGDDKYAMAWNDGVVTVKDLAHPVKPAAPSARIRGLIAQVPKDVEGWIVSGGFPKYKITQSVAWLQSRAETWHFVVTGESNEPGVAKEWLSGIITGFKQAAAKKDVPVDDSWFKLTENGNAARLEGDIPNDLFTKAQ